MLHYLRIESPQLWGDLQKLIAGFYWKLNNAQRAQTSRTSWRDPGWQALFFEKLYHALCLAGNDLLSTAIGVFVGFLHFRELAVARRSAELVYEAGRDAQLPEVESWGERLLEGLGAYEAGKYDVAAELGQELTNLEYRDVRLLPMAVALSGKLYKQAGRYQEALTQLTDAIGLAVAMGLTLQAVEYLIERAEAHTKMREYRSGLADYSAALDLQPDSVLARLMRTQMFLRLHQFSSAFADLEAGERYNPAPFYYVFWGQALRLAGRYEDALEYYDKAIALGFKPDSRYYTELGMALASLGRYEEAVRCYRDGIRAIPEDEGLRWGLAVVVKQQRGIEAAQGYTVQAKSALQAAKEKDPSDPTFYGEGVIAVLQGNIEQALDYLHQAIESEPGTADFARHDIAWHDVRDDKRFQALIAGT
ncbi:MAG TPA: tetratricopeptide repeat protein [Chloroflexia bacterium]|jgi:pentatricopeptide repeat protein